MNPNFKHIFSVVFLICAIVLNKQIFAQTAYLNGTMIDTKDGEHYTRTQFNNYLQELYNMNINKIVFNAVGIIKKDNGKLSVTRTVLDDSLAWMTDMAKNNYNMNVYVGLYADVSNAGFLNQLTKDIIINDGELVSHLSHSTFRNNIDGYYIFQELEVCDPYNDSSRSFHFYKSLDSTIKARDNSRRLIVCGYLNQLYPDREYKSTDSVKNWIKYMFYNYSSNKNNGINADIFLFQDGVGGWEMPIINPDSSLPNLADYLSSIKKGFLVNNPEERTTFWIETELYQSGPLRPPKVFYPPYNTTWNSPSFIKLVSQQISVEKNYSDTLISWTNAHMTEYPASPTWKKPITKKSEIHLLRGYNAMYFGKGKWYGNSFNYKYTKIKPNTNYPSPEHPIYSDPKYEKLKDNNIVQQSRTSWHGDKLVGFLVNPNNNGITDTIVIIADLNKFDQPVSDVSVITTAQKRYNILYPKDLIVYVSNDTTNWKFLGKMSSMDPNFHGYNDQINADSLKLFSYRAEYFVSSSYVLHGRYVKIEIIPKEITSWVMLNEIEIYSYKNSP